MRALSSDDVGGHFHGYPSGTRSRIYYLVLLSRRLQLRKKKLCTRSNQLGHTRQRCNPVDRADSLSASDDPAH